MYSHAVQEIDEIVAASSSPSSTTYNASLLGGFQNLVKAGFREAGRPKSELFKWWIRWDSKGLLCRPGLYSVNVTDGRFRTVLRLPPRHTFFGDVPVRPVSIDVDIHRTVLYVGNLANLADRHFDLVTNIELSHSCNDDGAILQQIGLARMTSLSSVVCRSTLSLPNVQYITGCPALKRIMVFGGRGYPTLLAIPLLDALTTGGTLPLLKSLLLGLRFPGEQTIYEVPIPSEVEAFQHNLTRTMPLVDHIYLQLCTDEYKRPNHTHTGLAVAFRDHVRAWFGDGWTLEHFDLELPCSEEDEEGVDDGRHMVIRRVKDIPPSPGHPPITTGSNGLAENADVDAVGWRHVIR